jgi:hypothetical protein
MYIILGYRFVLYIIIIIKSHYFGYEPSVTMHLSLSLSLFVFNR